MKQQIFSDNTITVRHSKLILMLYSTKTYNTYPITKNIYSKLLIHFLLIASIQFCYITYTYIPNSNRECVMPFWNQKRCVKHTSARIFFLPICYRFMVKLKFCHFFYQKKKQFKKFKKLKWKEKKRKFKNFNDDDYDYDVVGLRFFKCFF